jgi:excisionase family DNA binding protein
MVVIEWPWYHLDACDIRRFDFSLTHPQNARYEPATGSTDSTSKEPLMSRDEPAGMSIPEAAAYVGISPNSMRRALVRGEIPFLKLGVRVIVPRAALDKLFEGAIAGPRGVPIAH